MASSPPLGAHAKTPHGESDQHLEHNISPAVAVETTVEDDTGKGRKSEGNEAIPAEHVRETPGVKIGDSIEDDKPPSLFEKVKGKISKVIGHDHAEKEGEDENPRLSYEVAATASPESGAIPRVKEA